MQKNVARQLNDLLLALFRSIPPVQAGPAWAFTEYSTHEGVGHPTICLHLVELSVGSPLCSKMPSCVTAPRIGRVIDGIQRVPAMSPTMITARLTQIKRDFSGVFCDFFC